MKRFVRTITISVILLLFFSSGFYIIYGHINRFLPKSKIHKPHDEGIEEEGVSSGVSYKEESLNENTNDENSIDFEDTINPRLEHIPLPIFPQGQFTSEDRAGEVETLSYGDIKPDTIFSINLSEHPTAFAFRWSEGVFYYGLSEDLALPRLHKVVEDDEQEGSEDFNVSVLYTTGIRNSKFIVLYPQTPVSDLEVSLITSYDSIAKTRGGFNTQLNYDSGASYSSLPIISRDEWGAELSSIDDPEHLVWDPYYYHANRIIIHHTVTPNEPTDPEIYVRAVYLYHKNTKGWGDIGYNYLIDHLGNIYEGKLGGDEVKGYHAGSQANRGSIGISFLGNFEEGVPTLAARTALIKLMAEKGAFYGFNLKYGLRDSSKWVNSSYTVFGHKDAFNLYSGVWTAEATACPGRNLYELLPSLTKNAQEYKASHFAKIKSTAIEANEAFSRKYEANTLYVIYDRAESVSKQTILNLIPSYSGITSRAVRKNMAIIKVSDWDNGGYIPPATWDRYITESVQTYFPESGGTEDRLKTLYKIFRLDSDVQSVRLNYIGEFN